MFSGTTILFEIMMSILTRMYVFHISRMVDLIYKDAYIYAVTELLDMVLSVQPISRGIPLMVVI